MQSHPLTILMIEDDPEYAQLISKRLIAGEKMAELTLKHATRLSSGLDSLQEEGVDLILLDLSLPDSQGLETFIKMQQQTSSIPVIILTGIEDQALALQTMQKGAQDYLIKGRISGSSLERSICFAIERQLILEKIKKDCQHQYDLATHDPLTNLPNRLLFQDRGNQALAMAHRRKQMLALIFIDLDQFKSINDYWGHAVGDLLLQKVAKSLSNCVRQEDTLARMGGDEFTILLSELKEITDAAKVSERILEVMSHPFILDDQQIKVTLSLGISLYPFDGSDLVTLVKKGDFTMYRTKQAGGNGYQFFEMAMNLSRYPTLNSNERAGMNILNY